MSASAYPALRIEQLKKLVFTPPDEKSYSQRRVSRGDSYEW
jgi:hypothetical protein